MSNNFNVTSLAEKTESSKLDLFNKNINSSVLVNLDLNNSDSNEWMTIFEETLPNLDTILRNPNRFIINEEDIVKIELAKRVTVESIKHLSQNTNLIQDIDKKSGNVRPAKILNVNKEETFETYENKFIYSLIQNMKVFVEFRKRELAIPTNNVNSKVLNYNGVSKIGGERVDINLNVNSKIDLSKSNGEAVVERIRKIEERIKDLTYQQTYKDIERRHISLVVSPIKKTNLILKNVNFQKAVILWNYIQEHIVDKSGTSKVKKSYQDNGDIHKFLDETFLLNYLVINTLETNKEEIDKETLKEKVSENMVGKLLSIDENITEKELKDLIGKQFTKIKYKTVVNDSDIRKIFIQRMEKFISKIESLEGLK